MVPCDTIDTPFDILEIIDQRTLMNQTTYLVSQWKPEQLTQRQIDIQTEMGFKAHTTFLIEDNLQEPLYEVHWQPAWQTYETIMATDSGPTALDKNKRTK
jgi:hypothetical protein